MIKYSTDDLKYVDYNGIYTILPGAYELLMAVKEHETYTACRVPSLSKSITKYFPYTESKILLFEAVS